MRNMMLTLGLVLGVLCIPAIGTPGFASGSAAYGTAAVPEAGAFVDQTQQPQPPQSPEINIEVNRGGGQAWYRNPVWIAIGGLALAILVLLIVLAARGGGGTTVVRG